jgi:prepilin-type N-terminal cleavage/methylation domain-containing protein
MKYYKYCRGFTLIEMAVVLVIVGLLVGSFVGTVSSRLETTRYAETKKDLADIKQAIIGYSYKNGVLPCPDSDGDGKTGPGCVATGYVPWVTLGLGAGDAWNNRYEYWLYVTNFSVPFDLDTDAATGAQVMARSADGTTLVSLASNVVAVIFSRGKNGLGALGVNGSNQSPVPGTGHDDEIENGDGDRIFVSRPPTYGDDATNVGTFDDQMLWISEFELKAKMVDAGKLP